MADFNLFDNDICLSILHNKNTSNWFSVSVIFFDEEEY